MPISEDIASRIICLPLYLELKQNELQQIVSILNSNL
jgi:dTDP-4-amino-4,6-dideoxygalactose transaminase